MDRRRPTCGSSWAVALAVSLTACGGDGGTDAGSRDGSPDAISCDEVVRLDGFVPLPDLRVLHWLGYADERGALPIGTNNRFVTAALLDEDEFQPVWYVERLEDSAGSLRWEQESAGGPMYRRRVPTSPLDAFHYLLWRPRVAESLEVELAVYERWPYGPLGACGIDNEQVVPTPTRLWFFRRNQCDGDPDLGSEVRARLHGFRADGGEATPPEGVPLRGEVLWYAPLTSPMQAHSDDGVSYVISDRGESGTEEEALYWERRGVSGALVARSEALVTRAELTGTGSVWGFVTGDDAYLFYAHVTRGPASVFARIEGNGTIAWLHRFEGSVANDNSNLSRVQPFRGGLVALLARSDGSGRTVVRIASDGVVERLPGGLTAGSVRSPNVALAADDWGVMVAVGDADPTQPVTISRYDWAGGLVYSREIADSELVDRYLLARADGRGGFYLFYFSSFRATYFQHFDALARPAAWYRQYGCVGRDYVREIHRYIRDPSALPDGGILDAAMRDAAASSDAGSSAESDAWAETDATIADAGRDDVGE